MTANKSIKLTVDDLYQIIYELRSEKILFPYGRHSRIAHREDFDFIPTFFEHQDCCKNPGISRSNVRRHCRSKKHVRNLCISLIEGKNKEYLHQFLYSVFYCCSLSQNIRVNKPGLLASQLSGNTVKRSHFKLLIELNELASKYLDQNILTECCHSFKIPNRYNLITAKNSFFTYCYIRAMSPLNVKLAAMHHGMKYLTISPESLERFNLLQNILHDNGEIIFVLWPSDFLSNTPKNHY